MNFGTGGQSTNFPSANGTRWLLFAWLGTALLLGGLLLNRNNPWQGTEKAAVAPSAPPAAEARQHPDTAGPWGELEYVHTVIEIPDHYVTVAQFVEENSHWHFNGHTREQIAALFTEAGVTAAQNQMLLEAAQWEQRTNGWVITPPRELVLGLSPPARSRIYSVLARFEENPAQLYAYAYRNSGAEEWLARSGLGRETLGRLQQMLYPRGASILFSDLPELLSVTSSPAEKFRVMKTISRASALIARLRMTPGINRQALADYWGSRGRTKDIRPLLESVPDGESIDIVHLLPPLPRKYLFTFPFPAERAGPAWDCHWTALNFFNLEPLPNYEGFASLKRMLDAEYYPVEGPPHFGDIILFSRGDGIVLHSAVYIADDVVFTKNGGHFQQPWLLMKIPDVIARYPSDVPVRGFVFRHKAT